MCRIENIVSEITAGRDEQKAVVGLRRASASSHDAIAMVCRILNDVKVVLDGCMNGGLREKGNWHGDDLQDVQGWI